jgi:NAD(P)-dependent dehydrogenase (short-subunit alcohol dehydrogenase family)
MVTGASSGLGPHLAVALAAAGADVVVAARRADRLAQLSAEIGEGGGRCHPVGLDVRVPSQIVAAVDEAQSVYGTVTILVNNAAVADEERPHELSVEMVDSIIETNVRGPYLLACEVARRLIAAKRSGSIVNISSMSAYQYTGGGTSLYSLTKAALNRMTEALAVEWASFGINVNAIAPGAFLSEMTESRLAGRQQMTSRFPRVRLLDPARIASTLLFLVAPSSEYVTGTIVKVDDCQLPR